MAQPPAADSTTGKEAHLTVFFLTKSTRIHADPGRIELIEDTTGKGHTTRAVGNEDRISIAIPLADQTLGAPLR